MLAQLATMQNHVNGAMFQKKFTALKSLWQFFPNGLFNEGSKAVSVGVDAVYQNAYTASLSYTDFFGGDYNTLVDRDFLALSVGVNF